MPLPPTHRPGLGSGIRERLATSQETFISSSKTQHEKKSEKEDDDYMTMSLSSLEEPQYSNTRSRMMFSGDGGGAVVETSLQRRVRRVREGEIRAHQKSKAEMAEEEKSRREELLGRSLIDRARAGGEGKKGLRMLERMGFSLGREAGLREGGVRELHHGVDGGSGHRKNEEQMSGGEDTIRLLKKTKKEEEESEKKIITESNIANAARDLVSCDGVGEKGNEKQHEDKACDKGRTEKETRVGVEKNEDKLFSYKVDDDYDNETSVAADNSRKGKNRESPSSSFRLSSPFPFTEPLGIHVRQTRAGIGHVDQNKKDFDAAQQQKRKFPFPSLNKTEGLSGNKKQRGFDVAEGETLKIFRDRMAREREAERMARLTRRAQAVAERLWEYDHNNKDDETTVGSKHKRESIMTRAIPVEFRALAHERNVCATEETKEREVLVSLGWVGKKTRPPESRVERYPRLPTYHDSEELEDADLAIAMGHSIGDDVETVLQYDMSDMLPPQEPQSRDATAMLGKITRNKNGDIANDYDQGKVEDNDPELSTFESLEPSEKLRRVLSYLRDEFKYCFWCKHRYNEPGLPGCPGITEEEHD